MKMIYYIWCGLILIFTNFTYCTYPQEQYKYMDKSLEYNALTEEEKRVILHKGTEMPFTGKFLEHKEKGVYVCKQCGKALYKSESKFDSHCGWPSFDDEIEGAVRRVPDADGKRIEIVCNNCSGHLGHVFVGEGYTPKNIRHCVNSISLDFLSEDKYKYSNKVNSEAKSDYSRAIFASGCFWGTEYYLQKEKGVVSTTVGYCGGSIENPSYEDVCTGKTGHAESIEVIFDPKIISYENLTRLFFETHDPTQVNRQGPDIGTQYRSAIFYLDDDQKETAEKLIDILKNKGFKVATEVTRAGKFWKAEDYHQDYYILRGKTPYCHFYRKLF